MLPSPPLLTHLYLTPKVLPHIVILQHKMGNSLVFFTLFAKKMGFKVSHFFFYWKNKMFEQFPQTFRICFVKLKPCLFFIYFKHLSKDFITVSLKCYRVTAAVHEHSWGNQNVQTQAEIFSNCTCAHQDHLSAYVSIKSPPNWKPKNKTNEWYILFTV